MGKEALRCSLSLSPKVISDSPIYSSSQPAWVHLTYRSPIFLSDGVLILGDHQKVTHSVSSLKVTLYSNFITDILKTFIEPFGTGDNYVDVTDVSFIVAAILVFIGLDLGLNGTLPVVDLGL